MPFAIEPTWAWIIAGLLLGGCELLAPGAFLIWIGLGAVATGFLVSVVTLPWEVQVLGFAIFAGLAVLLGRHLMRSSVPDLNRRGHSLVGRRFVLDTPIIDGVGRLRLGDTSWRMIGPDLPAGTGITIVALDGATLVVRAAAEPHG